MPQLRHRPRDLVQNRYEIKKLLGSGAFGTVYGCTDSELQTPVALKEMHVLDERDNQSGGDREAALAQFRAEAIHLSRLNHPHIVRGHYERDNGSWRICPVCGLDFPQLRECPDHGGALELLDARHYLVMEYVAGPDLLARSEAEGGRLDVEEALGWMREIASALAHVHARGFVHRDLKPENIRLRGESGEAVLLDFGIASQNDIGGDRYGTRPRRATTGGGTPGYAPPTPREANSPDARSDVFAFGMTWYHLLCGLDPTEPSQERQMFAQRLRAFRPEIPGWLDDLICECIAHDPNQRPQNGQELLERLETGEEVAPSAAIAPSHGVAGMTTGVPVPATPSSTPQVTPLLFRSGHYARDLNDLVWLCDEFPDEAAKRLGDGEFERWLRSQNNETLARAASEARQNPSKRAALETWVQQTGLVERPVVSLSPPLLLDFGSFGKETQKTRKLKLQKSGRGWVFGRAQTDTGALSCHGSFQGDSPEIDFTFDAFRLRPGKYDGRIQLSGSFGDLMIPWTARVRGPSALVPFLVVLANGAFGMIAGASLRAVPFLVAHQNHTSWLGRNSVQGWEAGVAFGGVMAMCCLAWTLVFALFRRSCGILVSLGFASTLVSLYAAFMGGSWLMSGDGFLKPHLQPIVHSFAPGGWMYAGATLGALAGAMWRWRDLASMRFWAVFAGFGATLLMVYLALEGALKN